MLTKVSKVVFSCFLFVLSLSLLYINSRAQESTGATECSPCAPEKCISDSVGTLKGINLTSMADHSIIADLTSLDTGSTGSLLDEKMGCTQFLINDLQVTPPEGMQLCDHTPETQCQNQVNAAEGPDHSVTGSSRYANRTGSILHLGYAADNYMRDTPAYANLAYFMGKTTERIPFVNKAFAQTVDYRHTLIAVVFDIWRVTRNLALALMSIILLVIGIMIILRKKVNQQVVVSVQYALPKIILAFILIIMSYPIGATLTSVSWTLHNNARTIVAGMFTGLTGGTNPDITIGYLINFITVSVVSLSLTGGLVLPGLMVLISAVGAIVSIAYIFFLIKAFLLYLKMVVSIISAPIEFVIGAIPGSDDKVAAWFRRMITYGVSLFLMKAIFWLGLHTSIKIVSSGFESGATGFMISALVPVLIMVYSVGIANSIESRVQKFVDPGSVKK
jgi:hypothetical protein